MDKSTSDEKLLKLMENTTQIKRVQKAGVKPKKSLPFKFNFRSFRLFRLNLYNLNKGLFLLSGLLTLSFFYSLISGTKMVKADLIFPPSEVSPAISKLITPGGERFLSQQEYLSEIGKRNIFLAPEQKSLALTQQPQQQEISGLIKDLKLVGIIWSSNPEVMIENTKEKRTYLLKKDETFGGPPFKIKNILRNAVVLEIPTTEGAKEYELK